MTTDCPRCRARWPQGWNPPHILAWRLLWCIPWYAARILFALVTLIAFGPRAVGEFWDAT